MRVEIGWLGVGMGGRQRSGRRGPTEMVFNCQMQPKRYPKQSKMEQKGSHTEPMNIPIHPWRAGSKKVSKEDAKRHTTGVHFLTKSIKITKNSIQQSAQTSVMEIHENNIKTMPKENYN